MASPTSSQRDAEAKLERMLDDYHKTLPMSYRVPLFGSDPLRTAIGASPELKERLVAAVRDGYLDRFSNEPLEPGAKAEYRTGERKMVVPESALADGRDLVFVLGHETQHANGNRGLHYRREVLQREVDTIARGPQPHDYTEPVAAFVDYKRWDEAQAHIGGFNAVVSALAADHKAATPAALYAYDPLRMRDFIDVRGAAPQASYQLKAGLTQEPDGSLAPSRENLETMKRHYADKMPGQFGENGLLNYRHEAALDGWQVAHGVEMQVAIEGLERKYEARKGQPHPDDIVLDDGFVLKAVVDRDSECKRIARAEDPQISYQLDFARFGLHPALVDVSRAAPDGRTVTVANPALVEGVRDTFDTLRAQTVVDRDVALRALARPQPVPNPVPNPVSASTVSASGLDAVAAPSTTVRTDAPGVPSRADPVEAPLRTTTTTTTPGGVSAAVSSGAPVSPLYQQALDGLGRNPQIGIGDPDQLRNVAAGLALAAHKQGLTRIDHVLKGDTGNVFAVEGADPHKIGAARAHVDLETVSLRPAQRSLAELNAAPALPAPSQEVGQRQGHGLPH